MRSASIDLDVDALRKITSYAHWMPALRGISEEYIARNYPGWEWNQIIPILIKKGIVKMYSSDVSQRKLSHHLSIAADVRSISLKKAYDEILVTIRTSNLIAKEECTQ